MDHLTAHSLPGPRSTQWSTELPGGKKEAARKKTEDHQHSRLRWPTEPPPCDSCRRGVGAHSRLPSQTSPGPMAPTSPCRQGMVGRGARTGGTEASAHVRRRAASVGQGLARWQRWLRPRHARRSQIFDRGPSHAPRQTDNTVGWARGRLNGRQQSPGLSRGGGLGGSRSGPERGPARHAAGGIWERHVETRSALGAATLPLRCAGVSGPLVRGGSPTPRRRASMRPLPTCMNPKS